MACPDRLSHYREIKTLQQTNDCSAKGFIQPTLLPTLAGYAYFNAQHSS